MPTNKRKAVPHAVVEMFPEGRSSDWPVLPLTQSEVEDLDLLCYSLGSARNACINFATKYLCSLWLHSTIDVKLPQPRKPSKVNPPQTVEYRLNPEVMASIKAVRNQRTKLDTELDTVSEGEIAKRAVLHLCKKLLPAKTRRLALSFPRQRGAS